MPKLKGILFKSDGISGIDASGEDMLSLLVDRLRSGGYDVYFSGLNERVIDALHRSHLYEKIGKDHMFATVLQATESIWEQIHIDTNETNCPLRHVVPLEKEVSEPELRILLVDDNEDFANTLRKQLVKQKMNVDVCYDGRAAINNVSKNEYDMVILDMRLHGESGDMILRELTDIRPGLAVILLTEDTNIDSAVEAMKHGAFDYILKQKPCNIDQLAAKIRRAHRERT